MDAYERLIDGLPPRLPAGGARRGGEKAIRDAVAHVPLANPPQALRELERILDDMLSAAWRGASRAAVLAMLHDPVRGLCRGLGQQLGSESHPLPPASAERAAAAQRLEWKLACNDALALHELCAPAGKVPLFRGKLAAGLAVAGLESVGSALAWSYRQYRAPPAGTWLRTHALYLFAAAGGVADQTSAETRPRAAPLTPRVAYLRVLLLAASDPYRWSARELHKAIAVIGAVADRCRLTDGATSGIPVDTAVDDGPGVPLGEATPESAAAMTLDVEAATRSFEERIAGLADAAGTVEFADPAGDRLAVRPWFLRRLAGGWARAQRGHARLPAGHALDLAVGMHALHRALAGNVDFATFLRQVRGDAITVGRHELASTWMVTGDAATPANVRGEVLDQSLEGYRLRVRADDGARLRIGEVVGLAPAADPDDERDWMVGVIRWLRIDEAQVLVGVKLLHRTSRAAGLRAVTRDGEALVPQRAVELPGATAAGGLAVLLTHPLAPDVHTVEVLLPPLDSDWTGVGGVSEWQRGGTEVLGSTCVRVTLQAGAGAVEEADARE